MQGHFVCLLPTCCKLGPAMPLGWPVTALAAFVMLTCNPQPARVDVVSVPVFDTRALAARLMATMLTLPATASANHDEGCPS